MNLFRYFLFYVGLTNNKSSSRTYCVSHMNLFRHFLYYASGAPIHICSTIDLLCSLLTYSLISILYGTLSFFFFFSLKRTGYSFPQSALFCSVFSSCEPTLMMTRLETPAITSPQYCFLLDSFLISRRSKKQFIVSYLNNKAKYLTLSHDDVFHVQIKYIEIDCHFVRRLH